MFFYFLKIIFDISTLKRFKKYKPHSILIKNKISKFNETQLQTHCQTVFKYLRENKAIFRSLRFVWQIGSKKNSKPYISFSFF